VRGRPWTEFRTLVADRRRGRFRTSYQFTDQESRGVAFAFRVVALDQSGWPYAAAASAVRIVRGR
jgi:hypothetical protein